MYTLATVDALRQQLQLSQTDAAAESQLRDALVSASQLIESGTRRRYAPFIETRQAAINPRCPREAILPADLLELIALSCDGAPLAASDIRRVPADPDTPASLLILGFAADPGIDISIHGIWGWHDRWRDAWRHSGDALQGEGLAKTAESLLVNDVAGADPNGLSPRFQVGQLLRVDSEYLRLIAIDSALNQLTVLRGVNGSIATAHASGTAIEAYAPPAAIRELCLRYASLILGAGSPLQDESLELLRNLRRQRV